MASSSTDKGAGPLKTPIAAPLSTCTVPEQTPLTAEQETKYSWLLEQIKEWKDVPSQKDKEHAGPLTDSERMWLTRECLLRYLRATKWHEKESEKRIRDTLAWRREFGVERLSFDHISPEQETGKQVILGYDNEGRACHYLNPGRQNTEPSHRQVEHLVFMLERVIELMPAQRDKLVLLINFKTSKSRSNTAPGIGQGREVLHILQTHYPERLGRALIVNVPWVVWGFFKLITPFIDPLTREKLKFNEDMRQYVPADHLWTEFNGALDFDYDHATYWPALQKMCEERRAERERRWGAGGKQIGELEDYLSGHVAQGVAPAGSAAVDAPAPAPAAADVVAAAPALSSKPAGDLMDEKKAGEDQVEDLQVGELKVI